MEQLAKPCFGSECLGWGANFGVGAKLWVRVKILMGAQIWVGGEIFGWGNYFCLVEILYWGNFFGLGQNFRVVIKFWVE